MPDPRKIAASYVAAIRARDELVEKALIRRIEEIEGRVPTNAEISRHGGRSIYRQSGREEFRWKGQLIVAMESDWTDERVSFRVTT